MSTHRDDTYFATLPPEEIGKAIISKVTDYYGNSLVSQITRRQWLAWKYYYGYDREGFHGTSSVSRGGDEGEFALVRVNNCRSLANALVAMITTPQFDWRPSPASNTYASIKKTQVAKAVLEHYWQNRRVGRVEAAAVEQAVVLTEGFTLTDWDEYAGAKYIDGRTGDYVFQNVAAWNVIRDPTKRTWDEIDYVIVRTWHNRFDLAARWPASRDAILNAPRAVNIPNMATWNVSAPTDWNTDDVEVLRLYHKSGAMLPNGREVRCLADGTVLGTPDEKGGVEFDEQAAPRLAYHDLPLGEMPLGRITPDAMIDTPFGYSPFFEILGMQEVIDSLHTSVSTSITTLGHTYIAVEEGSDPDIMGLGSPLSIIPYKRGSKPPQGITLSTVAPGTFEYLSKLEASQVGNMGLNTAALGESPGDRASGSLAALLSAQAIQRAGPLQKAYHDELRARGSYILRGLNENATMPLKMSLVGATKRGIVQDFEVQAGDFKDVSDVYVDIGNPMTQSPEGRLELAKLLVQMKPDDMTFEVIAQIVETGKIDAATEADSEEMTLILGENEMISEAKRPVAMIQDNHLLHGRQHSIPMASPSARKNMAAIESYNDHMLSHYAFLYAIPLLPPPNDQFAAVKSDPLFNTRMLALTQGVLLPPPMPMMPPPGAEGPSATPPPSGGPPSATPPPEGGEPSGSGPKSKMPEKPTNPSTGRKWNPVDGGGVAGS